MTAPDMADLQERVAYLTAANEALQAQVDTARADALRDAADYIYYAAHDSARDDNRDGILALIDAPRNLKGTP